MAVERGAMTNNVDASRERRRLVSRDERSRGLAFLLSHIGHIGFA